MNSTFSNSYKWGHYRGTPANSVTRKKLKFCKLKDTITAPVNVLPITGDVATGLGVGHASADWYAAVLSTGYQDIHSFIGNGGIRHPGGYASGTVDWYSAALPWGDYDNWSSNETLNPDGAVPNESNGGAIHIFANFLQQTGQGNGTVNLITNNQDPQPNVPC